MFRSHITRPLLWAIPLAVLGGVAAAVWYLRPLEIDVDGIALDCREIGIAAGADWDPCGDARRERFLVSGLILVAGGLPLVLVVLRACVWAADTLAAVRHDLRRLHERLDRERAG
jgi:hypothetical protein